MTALKVATALGIALLPLVATAAVQSGDSLALKCHGVSATIVSRPGVPTVGGPGRDVIVGTQDNDQIDGRGGNDLVCGRGGNDILIGGAGDDRLDGGPGSDVLAGQDGNDRLEGGVGSDGFDGGPGNDRISGGPGTGPVGLDVVLYTNAEGPVRVDLAAGTASGDGSDVLSGIDTVGGSRFDDVLLGDASVNFLSGEGGNDVLDGRGGDDSALFGDVGVNANLATGTSVGEGLDQLKNLEGLIGSHQDDTLTGNGGTNYLAGSDGNDTIAGGSGEDRVYGDKGNDNLDGGPQDDILGGNAGNDVLVGGGGLQDTVSYLSAQRGVQADLATGQATGEGSDTLSGIQNVSGSQFADKIIGDAEANGLSGNAGRDRIVAGAGADFLGGGSGNNVLNDGSGADYCLDGSGAARCEIKGLPGPLPGRPGLPPISTQALTAARAAPIPPAPGPKPGLRRFSRLLTPSERAVTLRFEEILQSAGDELSPARARARTAPYDYVGQPTCLLAERETTIAPPRRVEPIGRDNSPEEAWWQATLFRQVGGGPWKRYRQTRWLTSSIAGVGIAGSPVWQDAKRRTFVNSLPPIRVPAGKYVWKGEIYWARTGGIVYRDVEPHVVYAPTAPIVRHEKLCAFRG